MPGTAEETKTFRYRIRPLEESDIPALVDFFNETDALEGVTDTSSVGEFTTWYHNPMNTSTYMPAFLLEEDGTEGKLIAQMDFGRRKDDFRGWGWMHVHPHYRNRGVGRALYAEFERLAREAGVTSLHFTPDMKANLLLEFLQRRGYEFDRYFWEMQLPAEQAVPEARLPEGFAVRTFVPGQDEELLTHVRNVTFREHYGSVERTVEEMVHLTREEHFRPEAVFFAFDGDEIAGFCLNGIDPREEERRGVSVGHVHTLGVMPSYRGRGIGKALLLISVNYLRRHASLVELGVEGKNENALKLYEGVGFHKHKGWANMVKPLS
jgi:mycothiol synthase